MNQAGLLELCAYGKYANHLLLDAAAQLAHERLNHNVCPSHGTILALLQHMFAGEATYLAKCQGRALAVTPGQVEILPDLRRYWLMVEEERDEYLASLDEQRLQSPETVRINGWNFKLTRSQMILESLIHSLHHRGELSVVLSDMGYPLPDLDTLIRFADSSDRD